ncbi:hypothetical protein ACFVSX_33610 [Streptomyces rubiginosohelvolus]|uniref:hypothetical protein n=1 Tax=Streptomyces rubiginosohelvolus TaxID=67362 RepID=UPI0036DCFE34
MPVPPGLLEPQTVAVLAAAYPGLRQTEPSKWGAPLADVRLTPQRTARFSWAGYEIHVIVGHEDHLDREHPDSTALYREIRAHATFLVPRADMAFPTAFAVAAADQADPRFAAAVLSTVAKALTYARHTTEHAADQAEEVRWESERPEGVNPRT